MYIEIRGLPQASTLSSQHKTGSLVAPYFVHQVSWPSAFWGSGVPTLPLTMGAQGLQTLVIGYPFWRSEPRVTDL